MPLDLYLKMRWAGMTPRLSVVIGGVAPGPLVVGGGEGLCSGERPETQGM